MKLKSEFKTFYYYSYRPALRPSSDKVNIRLEGGNVVYVDSRIIHFIWCLPRTRPQTNSNNVLKSRYVI